MNNTQDIIMKARSNMQECPVSKKNESWLNPVQAPYVGDTIHKAREVLKTQFSPYHIDAGEKPTNYMDYTNLTMLE